METSNERWTIAGSAPKQRGSRARQTSLNRIVAVKMILAGDDDVKRFLDLAETAALKHKNIVAIDEVGQQSGQH